MKKINIKKLSAVLLTATVLFSGIPINAADIQETKNEADTEYSGSADVATDYEYTVFTDGTIEITKYIGSDTKVIIPETIDGRTVTSIGEKAFYAGGSLKSVEIPSGVTNIGVQAFSFCPRLAYVGIPDTVTKIGEDAFSYCVSLTNAVIPSGVTSIAEGTFFECRNLTSVTIPDGVRSIGSYAFGGCNNLTELVIPESVTNIDEDAFVNCSGLTENVVSESLISKTDTEIVQAQNSWDGTADTSWYSGSGSVFHITNARQLAGLAQLVNSGNTFAGKKINLDNDIFLNDESYQHTWIPIACGGNVFQGTFSGNRHVIYNMLTDAGNRGGLFGEIGENGLVKCVDISQGRLYSGGCIADTNQGIISFCNNSSWTGSSQIASVGGICNYNYYLVYGCKNYGEVWGSRNVGGIVGENMKDVSTISQCSNHGLVGAGNEASGIVHCNSGWVYNCYNKGMISNMYAAYPVGYYGRAKQLNAIVADNYRFVENCYSTGRFAYGETSANCNVIGRTYDIYSEINNCYALSLPGLNSNGVTIVSLNEMLQPGFVEKLDKQDRSGCSVWMKDANNINDGLPITAADYSYYTGKCKIQPEVWTGEDNQTIEAKLEDKEYTLRLSCYYNESEPVVTIANPGIAEITERSGSRIVKLKKAGTTQINIHFDETENCSSADCQITLKVTAGSVADNTSSVSLAKAAVTLSANTYSYDGKEKKPAVKSVKLNGATLKLGTDYSVSYKNNKNIGTATVTITGKGKYTGTVTKTFTITAKKNSTFTVGAYKYKITGSSTVAFNGLKSANTKKVTIPKTVKIGGKDFKVTSIAANALKNKKVTQVTVGNNVKTIGKNAFYKCTKLTKVTLGTAVTSIGETAFSGCTKLTGITVPSKVTTIGKGAFTNCKKLGTITIKSSKLNKVGKNAFKGIKATAKIKVPSKKLSAYKKLLKGKGQGKKVKIIK